jgi:hypothetical protein
VTRAAELHQASKIAAVERLGPDADDAAIANCACEMLAQYSERLEHALGGTVRTPWDAPLPWDAPPPPLDFTNASPVSDDSEMRYERQCAREGREP